MQSQAAQQVVEYYRHLEILPVTLSAWAFSPERQRRGRICLDRHRDASLRSAWQGCPFLLARSRQVQL